MTVVDHRLSHLVGSDQSVGVRHLAGHAGRHGNPEVSLEIPPLEIASVGGDGDGGIALIDYGMELVSHFSGFFLVPPPDPLFKCELVPVVFPPATPALA